MTAIAEPITTTPTLAPGAYDVDVNRLRPHPQNIRRDLGDLDELTESIRGSGVLEPLLALPTGEVVCGHRRLAAAVNAGVAAVPCVVRNLSPAQVIAAMLAENLQRTDITPTEEAAAYQQLLDLQVDEDMVCVTVGTRRQRVRERLQLLSLPDKARELLDARSMTLEAAMHLLKLREHPERMERVLTGVLHYHTPSPARPLTAGSLYAVDQELDQIKRAAKVEKATADAKAKGLKVVRMPSWNGKGSRQIGKGYGCLDVNAKAHASEKCHAVAIGDNGQVVPVCTKPANHPQPEDAGKGTGRRDWEAEQARDDANRALVIAALRDDPSLGGVIHALRLANVANRAVAHLREEAPETRISWDVQTSQWLHEHPTRDDQELLLAVDLIDGLDAWEGTNLPLLAWLEEHGGELSEDERANVAAYREAVAADPIAAFTWRPEE